MSQLGIGDEHVAVDVEEDGHESLYSLEIPMTLQSAYQGREECAEVVEAYKTPDLEVNGRRRQCFQVLEERRICCQL